MGVCVQLRALLWKNWLVQKRNKSYSALMVLSPLVVLFFISFFKRKSVAPEKPVYYNAVDIVAPWDSLQNKIYYFPTTSETNLVMDLLMNVSTAKHQELFVQGFHTGEEAWKQLQNNSKLVQIVLEFRDVTASMSVLPRNLKLTVRPVNREKRDWKTSQLFPDIPGDIIPFYVSQGVLFFQGLVGQAFVKYWLLKDNKQSNLVNFEIKTKRMADLSLKNKGEIDFMRFYFTKFCFSMFFISVILMTRIMVAEKGKNLKESMQLMGLKPLVYWLSWVVTYTIYLVPFLLLLLLAVSNLFRSAPVIYYTSWSLLFLHLLLFIWAMMAFAFMVTSFVDREITGTFLCAFLYSALFAVFFYVEEHGFWVRLAACLSFVVSFIYGCSAMGKWEQEGVGAQWSNFHTSVLHDDDDELTLLESMLLLLLDSVIYLTIYWYLDSVKPGQYGIPKPYNFCLSKSYWCPGKQPSEETVVQHPPEGNNFEPDHSGEQPGIRICSLRKVFTNKVAVDDITLNVYKGQITVLIGHNGAGKTTLISMLTGFIPQSSGTAVICGHDIRKNLAKVQSVMGVCPQQNVLFDDLTVSEHLLFFGKLKGASGVMLKEEVSDLIDKIGLLAEKKARAKTLSGGQKRRLSVGMALVGGSKVVILDEPCSGVDPDARRLIWSILLEAKARRIILMTTQFMDEAELLGDKIAIMAEGKIRCCGSAMFLKNLYGTGYHLVIEKNIDCDVSQLTTSIQAIIPECQVESVTSNQLSYWVSHSESAKFPNLFSSLEEKKDILSIAGFGITAATMEDIFFKVGKEDFKLQNTEKKITPVVAEVSSVVATSVNDTSPTVDLNQQFSKKTGVALAMSQLRALFVKKAITVKRSWILTLFQLTIPVVFPLLLIRRPVISTDPSLDLNLSPFGRTTILFTDGYNPSMNKTALKNFYQQQFNNQHDMEYFKKRKAMTFDNHTLKKIQAMNRWIFHKTVIIGMEVLEAKPLGSVSGVAFFNGYPLHAQPISVNYMVNAFVQFILNNSFSLHSTVYPIAPVGVYKSRVEDFDENKYQTQAVISIYASMCILMSLFSIVPVKEREVGSKHLQFVSGADPISYWLTTFLWDFAMFTLATWPMLLVLFFYGMDPLIQKGNWLVAVLIFFLYAWAELPFVYSIQLFFKSPAGAFICILMINYLSALATRLTIGLPSNVGFFQFFFALLMMTLAPTHNLSTCFEQVFLHDALRRRCELSLTNCKYTESECCTDNCGAACIPFGDVLMMCPLGIGSHLLAMVFQGAAYFILLFFIELHALPTVWYKIRCVLKLNRIEEYTGRIQENEDSDVAAERERITTTDIRVLLSTDSLVLVNLCKKYKNFLLKRICVGVPPQECFGLLGQNGAGKTTIFKILTGVIRPDVGDAYMNCYNISTHLDKVQKNMGYCPQFDGLIDVMTSRETLTMYARFRGVPEENIAALVNSLISSLVILPNGDTVAGKLSGGNKRKLSVGIALVGNPAFLLLDEPSAGMDPDAKKHMFTLLSKVRESGRTIIFTSHSMEECEALCTRIAIMVNGRFVCLGSLQHLKSRFGQGYTLIVKLGTETDGALVDPEPVIAFIHSHFSDVQMFDDQLGHLYFQVPQADLALSFIFRVMEEMKANFRVVDYSVRQTTLEQIFLSFIRGEPKHKFL